ncbi:hypothetical protein DRE_06418 [Drechslerella stenobrocha 248]|uniref:Uncharacterized protein n=1 Tax=Drechslerella stenobrocha 248 TaxID=1043628 RepID=W7I739_9PEZI|nr:hypothetical protein DRE_06418 [Drechslerella stenobrocha 248]
MLEYFSYRKFKKHQDAKNSGAKEVLDAKDEQYFEDLVDSPTAQEVLLPASGSSANSVVTSASPADTPPASETSDLPKKQTWKETVSDYAVGTYEKARQVKVVEHLPAFLQKKETNVVDKGKQKEGEAPPSVQDKEKEKEKEKEKDKKGKGKPKKEEQQAYYANLTAEEKELHNALDALSLAAQDGKAFSLSPDTRALLKSFTQILKDMINGVPTAYDDLINLFETKSKQLETMFNEMPGFLKRLAEKIPGALGLSEKTLAGGEGAGSGAGLAAQAATFGIPTLKQIATKPGIVADTLKTVVNAIKLRFPGIALGTNVVLSMALFVLLFVFWYCWKRGREVRLESERLEREAAEALLTESVLDDVPPPPRTDPSTSVTTTTNTTIDQVIPPESSGFGTAQPAPIYPPPQAEPRQEKQIKDLF